MPDLKETIFQKILDHLDGELKEVDEYKVNYTTTSISFTNGSEIISRSWHDKKYKKFRSLELSAAIIEEVTESSPTEFEDMYKELFPRVGRIPGIYENFICGATNPDAPTHPVYEHWMLKGEKMSTRKVFYSSTGDNPFLPDTYIESIKATLTTQEIKRYIYGEWVEIKSEVIYYAYDPVQSGKLSNYRIKGQSPIYISWDFNIGHNKPMSAILSQYIDDTFYVFDEIILYSSRTLDVMEELNGRGYLDYNCEYIIHGDATGKSRNTRSIKSDYDIIGEYLANLQNSYGDIRYRIDVPRSNPPVRTRHTLVNGQLKNAYGKVSVLLDPKKCKTLDKGLRSTKLVKGGSYTEDDSDYFQHCTTALGYHLCRILSESDAGNRFKKTKLN
jgi:hypothetical protein